MGVNYVDNVDNVDDVFKYGGELWIAAMLVTHYHREDHVPFMKGVSKTYFSGCFFGSALLYEGQKLKNRIILTV